MGEGGLQEAKSKGFRNFWEELKGDRLDLVLLLFLYTLQVDLFFRVASFRRFLWLGLSVNLTMLIYLTQGLPIGLAEAIPLLMSERGASYEDQVAH